MKIISSFALFTLINVTTKAHAETIRTQAQRLRNPDINVMQASATASAVVASSSSGTTEFTISDESSNHLNYILDAFATLDELSMPFVEGTDTIPPVETIAPTTMTTSLPSTTATSTPVPPSSTIDILTATPTTSSDTVLPMTASPTSTPSSSPTSTPSDDGFVVAPPVASPVAPPAEPFSTPAPFGPLVNAPSLPISVGVCPEITDEERVAEILAILDAAANSATIRDATTPQGLATTWLLAQDQFLICPDNDKLLQRWATAVIYYSTGGDDWFLCSSDVTDNCGVQNPFASGESNFLSAVTECDWAGISCIDGCITEIEFEENNLAGIIPTEIALLTDLTIWGMERGTLTGTIPTEVGLLTNLIFIDLDFNQLTGTLSPELLSLSGLTQLDLNNNLLSGSINDIGVFPDMEFLQLHDNAFTGTVPDAVGSFVNLSAFTLQNAFISGTMPASVCDLLATKGNAGVLTSLIADCGTPNPSIECSCCTDCR